MRVKIGKRHYLNINQFIKFLIFTAILVIDAWFIISYLEVCCTNLSPEKHISAWNFFSVFIDNGGN